MSFDFEPNVPSRRLITVAYLERQQVRSRRETHDGHIHAEVQRMVLLANRLDALLLFVHARVAMNS